MRRALGILSVTMITAGCVVVVDVALTLAWKEPISAISAAIDQGDARAELDEIERSFLAAAPVSPAEPGSETAGAKRLADAFSDRLEPGSPVGEIRVPAAGIDQVVVEGTDADSLARGPGHYPGTALPGAGSTIGIAGHRTTYGAPFRDIDAIEDGDEIEVEVPYGTFTYEVESSRIVEPTDVEIVRDVGRERLVLTACHPLYSAAQRYAVFAALSAIELRGGAPGTTEL